MRAGNHDSPRQPLLAGLTLATLCAVSCGPNPGKQAFSQELVYEPVGKEIRFGATSAERFRLDRNSFQMPRASDSPRMLWTTPPGWSELPPTALRIANFRVAGDPNAECYLTTLTGEGGGLEANVNRWRSQMQQPPLGASEVAALPRHEMFGRPAVLVEVDGTWSGMSGDQSGTDYRLVGLLLVDPTESKFLKMTGPKAIVAAETAHFKELASSLHDHAQHAGGAEDPHGGLGTATGAMPQDAVHGMVDDGSAGLESHGGASESALAWAPPAGWTEGPEKAMREVTFLAGEKREVECYVTALGGDGGGLAANLNRWRSQMGRPDLTAAEIGALPKITMLGTEASLVEIERDGGGDVVIGAVCLRPDRSVFVKMLGPKSSVEAQRSAFVEFCKSIRTKG